MSNCLGLYKHNVTIDSLLKITGVLIIIAVLLPVMRFGMFGFKPDFPILLLSLILLIDEQKVARLKIIISIKIIAILLFFLMFISGNYGMFAVGTIDRMVVIPTEYLQVFSRVFVFYLFVYLGYKGVISESFFGKVTSIVFMIALLWGSLQIFNIPLVKSISLNYYALTDTQKNVFDKSTIRIFGTAGNVITWGGLSALFFYYFYFVNKNAFLKYLGCSLSFLNIFYSSSRAALYAFIISFIFVELFSSFFRARRRTLTFLKKIVVIAILLAVVASVLLWQMPERVTSIILRVENTEEDLTDRGRGRQLNYFLNYFDQNNEHYILGIGKATLDSLGYMEMEPFFLLFAYGWGGLLLHYILLFFLLKDAWGLRKIDLNSFYFVYGASLFYIIFSFGFFFFREAYSGLPFWWLCGFLIGSMYKKKHKSLGLIR